MLPQLFLGLVLLSAEPVAANQAAANQPVAADQAALLKTFRGEFVEITPGQGKFPAKFTMGRTPGRSVAEQPAHDVTMSKSFFIAKYEVPQNLWQSVMGNNPSRWKGPRNSVEMLTHAEAIEFCRKATELLLAAKLIEADQVVRLPTEAEWEYCARAGTTTTYSFGDAVSDLGVYGWFTGNAAGNDPPVGAKKPNPWGLYDMHGYLWEWCADPWHANYEGAPTDGSVWSKDGDAKRFVVRSGSWKDPAESLSSSFRVGLPADKLDDAVGLRCVLSRKP